MKRDILQLSFCGPFFYDFRGYPSGVVSIYAPKCPGHKTGIFTAKNEYPIRGRFKYGNQRTFALLGGVFADPLYNKRPNFCDPLELILRAEDILASTQANPPGSPPSLTTAFQNASFRLDVPVPQYVYPLNPSPELEVVTSDAPCGNLNRYATGLRFYYHACLDREITLLDCGKVVWYSDFDQICYSEIVNSDVMIRSADPAISDPDHDDATSCFDLISGVAGLSCWLSFENPQSPAATSGFAKGGNDCLSPVVTAGV